MTLYLSQICRVRIELKANCYILNSSDFTTHVIDSNDSFCYD